MLDACVSRREVLALGGMAAWQLREAVARWRGRRATPDGTKPALAGNGGGLVFGPAGSDWILCRIDGAGEPVLARNFSGRAWADNEQITVKRMSDGPEPALWKVVHRERSTVDLYATFNYSLGGGYTLTESAQKIYHLTGGALTDIGRPPITGTYTPPTANAGYQAQSIPQWDTRHASAVVLNGQLIKIAGDFQYIDTEVPPGINLGIQPVGSNVAFRTLVTYAPDSGWTERLVPYWALGFSTNLTQWSTMSNIAIDERTGRLYFFYKFNPGTIFSPSIRAMYEYRPSEGALSIVWSDGSYYGQPVQGGGFMTFLANFQQSFIAQLLPNRPQLVHGFVIGSEFSATAFETLYDGKDPNQITPAPNEEGIGQIPGTLFRTSGALTYNPAEAGWRVGDACYISTRSQLWKATRNVRDLNSWQPLYSYPGAVIIGGDSRTYGWKEMIDEATFGWFGQTLPPASFSGEPQGVIRGLVVSAGGSPDGALTYHGPSSLASGDVVYTLYKIDATGRTAVWSIVKPAGHNGQPVNMRQHNRKLYVTVGAGNVIGSRLAFTNPYIQTGIYEVDPAALTVRQVVGIPAELAGVTTYCGWQWLAGDTAPGNLLY